jgi:hypothetical protein
MVWLILLWLQAGMAMDVEISVKDSGLVVHRHGARLAPGECTLVVEAHNPSDEPRSLAPGSLTVLDAAGDALAEARYVRALVWADTDTRRRFTTFEGTLAPGERVVVRLFYGIDGKLPDDVLAGKQAIRYKGLFGGGAGPQVVEGAPFHAQVVEE